MISIPYRIGVLNYFFMVKAICIETVWFGGIDFTYFSYM